MTWSNIVLSILQFLLLIAAIWLAYETRVYRYKAAEQLRSIFFPSFFLAIGKRGLEYEISIQNLDDKTLFCPVCFIYRDNKFYVSKEYKIGTKIGKHCSIFRNSQYEIYCDEEWEAKKLEEALIVYCGCKLSIIYKLITPNKNYGILVFRDGAGLLYMVTREFYTFNDEIIENPMQIWYEGKRENISKAILKKVKVNAHLLNLLPSFNTKTGR
jgi:hypothetical protein